MPDPRLERDAAGSEAPSFPRVTQGIGLIVVITAAVAGWLWLQRPSLPSPTDSDTASPVTTLAGFRADAFFLPDDELLGFVEIPGGPFRMGSDPRVDPQAFENERWSPSAGQGMVDLETFYISRFEVTVAQYGAFIEASGRPVDAQTLSADARHPVANISWPDAVAYGRWLETELREWEETPPPLQRRLDDGWRLTLPNEAEWEKAARGSDGRIFPWGEEPRPDRGNFQRPGPMPVGSFPCPECPYGLSDMSGNVWELTRSPYRPYPYDPVVELDLDVDALWVMRGGSFTDPAQNVRTATRGGADPGVRRPFIGFRLVLTRSVP